MRALQAVVLLWALREQEVAAELLQQLQPALAAQAASPAAAAVAVAVRLILAQPARAEQEAVALSS